MIFFTTPIKTDVYHGAPSLKNLASPQLKNEAPFQELNTCVSLIKQHWKKLAEIPQKRHFLTWSIQIFFKKVEQFFRKYYITWLIDLANKLKFVIHWEK